MKMLARHFGTVMICFSTWSGLCATASASPLSESCAALLTELHAQGKVSEGLVNRLVDVPLETAIMYVELSSNLPHANEQRFLKQLESSEVSFKRAEDGRLTVAGPKQQLLELLRANEVQLATTESGVALEVHEAESPSDRESKSSFALLLQAAGTPRDMFAKLRRLVSTVGLYFDRNGIARRERALVDLGYVERAPNFWQGVFGSLDMLRFFIAPGARNYYASKGISFTFHQILRIFDDPVSMIDPIGIYSHRDTIITHIMQVVHGDPVYDFQLLALYPEGLTEFHRQLVQMIDGTHPRAKTLGAIVEDKTYHRRLLTYFEAYLNDPNVPRLARETNLALQESDPDFKIASQTFTTLPGFLNYATHLPTSFVALLHRYRNLKQMPALDQGQTQKGNDHE